MKKLLLLSAALMLFGSHDMFMKMGTCFLQPNSPASINLFNGTFEKSDNPIRRKRMKDVSLLGNGVRTHPDTSQWSEAADSSTLLNFKTGEPGTWVAGLSTHPNSIELTAAEFNEYLEHDGVLDMLEWRKQNNALGENAVEKYSKHVKIIFQVGDKKSEDWKTTLGYPIEFLPTSNPYDLKQGDTLQVKLLWNGQPLANQIVYAGSEASKHTHEHADRHEHKAGESHTHAGIQLRTDANGMVKLKLENEGLWYLRTIHLMHSQEPGLTHESNWATLTFEVGHGHSHAGGHGHSHGIPAYAYWMGGLALLAGVIFLVMRKRQ